MWWAGWDLGTQSDLWPDLGCGRGDRRALRSLRGLLRDGPWGDGGRGQGVYRGWGTSGCHGCAESGDLELQRGSRQGALPSGVAKAGGGAEPTQEKKPESEGEWALSGTLVSCAPGDGQDEPCDEKPWDWDGGVQSEHSAPRPPAGGGQPFSHRAVGRLGLKDKGRRGQGKELVAGSLMAPKKKHKTGELWGDINRAVRH